MRLPKTIVRLAEAIGFLSITEEEKKTLCEKIANGTLTEEEYKHILSLLDREIAATEEKLENLDKDESQ